MPYIKQEDRKAIDKNLKEFFNAIEIDTAGELNYVITRVVLRFIRRNGVFRYQDINDAIGALVGATLELYRRLVGPYENKKAKENGDVY
jgi:hypothetical protein